MVDQEVLVEQAAIVQGPKKLLVPLVNIPANLALMELKQFTSYVDAIEAERAQNISDHAHSATVAIKHTYRAITTLRP
jgi:hypothetical protein